MCIFSTLVKNIPLLHKKLVFIRIRPDTDLKIITLNHANNYVERTNIMLEKILTLSVLII